MSQCCCGGVSQETRQKIREIIEKHKGEQGALIPVLHEVQEFYGYLPFEVQKCVSEEMNVPLSEIYGVVTFYTRFSTTPVGKHRISVCLGTACYVKGADKLVEKIKEELGIDVNQTTKDNLFSFDITRCVGACGLAPVVIVNEEVHGKVVPEDIKGILDKYRNQ